MQVPLLDLRAQYATIADEVVPAVQAVLQSQDCCNGQAVRIFEQQTAEYSQCSHGAGVSSGTDALLCALMTLGIGGGDEVITTTFTFFATAGAIARTGAKPVFVDIEPDSYNLDPAKVQAAVTDKTKAIMPVHLYGQMADMDAIMAIAAKHDLAVIEDAAQAIGAEQNGRRACSIGTAGCLSFYPTKNLGAMGDAGMVLTSDGEFAERLSATRIHGGSQRYHHEWVGGNFRMDSIQAAVLSVKLRRLDQWTAARVANAARYNQAFADIAEIVTPAVSQGNTHIYHQYVIGVAAGRDELAGHLRDSGVACGVYYPLCLHEQPCFKELGYARGELPVAERAAEQVLALPAHPELTDEQISYVIDTIKNFLA